MILVQMHGEPGSGKSTVAKAIGRSTGAIVLDKDLLATGAIRAGTPFERAGPVAYETAWLVVPSLLTQGHSVIFDSPCYWPEIERQGREIASVCGAAYAMIECRCPPEVIDARLAARERLESNPVARGAGMGRPGMYEPSCERLVLDTTRPIDALAGEAAGWLATQARHGRPSAVGRSRETAPARGGAHGGEKR